MPTLNLIIQDAFSHNLFPAEGISDKMNVLDFIKKIASSLRLKLVDENMNRREYALKRLKDDTKLDNGRSLSSYKIDNGEILVIYGENIGGLL